MTTLREAAQQALKILELEGWGYPSPKTAEAITALRAALSEPEGGGNLPPQRKPLTEDEILKAVGWDIAEMYMKLTPNFPVSEARKETLKNARAIERAHGIT